VPEVRMAIISLSSFKREKSSIVPDKIDIGIVNIKKEGKI